MVVIVTETKVDAPRERTSHGPASILTCASCRTKNRIRPQEQGTPHCGKCGAALPWIVSATDDTFQAEARSSVAILVDLWAPWCGPCRFVAPILDEVAREYAGRLKVVKVNVDENPRLAGALDARSIPTMVVLRDGRAVDRIVGAMPKPDLSARLLPHVLKQASRRSAHEEAPHGRKPD